MGGVLAGKPRMRENYVRYRKYGAEQIHGRSSSGYLNMLVLGVWVLTVQKFCEINLANAPFHWLNCLTTFYEEVPVSLVRIWDREQISWRWKTFVLTSALGYQVFSFFFSCSIQHAYHICCCAQGLSLEFFLYAGMHFALVPRPDFSCQLCCNVPQ